MTTGIIERELQRTVWRRYRDTLCLVDASDPRFGEGGLAARMHELSMRVLVLPGDPERDLIAFDEEFWARFTQGHQDPISGNDAAWGSDARPTWSAACRVDDWNDGWRRALSIHHSGAVEVLVGRGLAWERGDHKVFSLVGIVGYVWNALAAWLVFSEWLGAELPWEVSVALVGTENARLGGFAQGWRDPDDPMGPAFRCHEHGLLLQREIHSPLDAEGVRQLAFGIGNQVEDAWGSKRRRFLIWNGEPTDKFDTARWHW